MRLSPFVATVAAALLEVAHAGEFRQLRTPGAFMLKLSQNGNYASAALDEGGLVVGGMRWTRATGDEERVPDFGFSYGVNNLGHVAGGVPVDGGIDHGGHDLAAVAPVDAPPRILPLLQDTDTAHAFDVSDNGVAVGDSYTYSLSLFEAVAWIQDNVHSLTVDAETIHSHASSISADGGTAVGWADIGPSGFRRGVLWRNVGPGWPDSESVTYIKDADGNSVGEALAISGNGKFAVGADYATPDGPSTSVAWRWSAETGQTMPIPKMRFAFGVSDDGNTVIGNTGFDENRIMMIWINGQGTIPFKDFLAAKGITRPLGWTILSGSLNAISGDGSTIGGCCGPSVPPPPGEFPRPGPSFVITGLNDPPDRMFRDSFDGAAAPNPIPDSSFEKTSQPGGGNVRWTSLDTNPDARGATSFYSETSGSVAAHSGIWAVFFGGWFNGAAERQDFSPRQSVVVPNGGSLFLNYWRYAPRLPDSTAVLSVLVDGHVVRSSHVGDLPAADVDYVPQSIEISEYADGAAHAIAFLYEYPGGDNDGVVFIDDVTLGARALPARSVAASASFAAPKFAKRHR